MKAGRAGGVEAVVKVINAHINNVDMCYVGCTVLRNMIVDNGKTLIKYKKHNANEQLRIG